MSATLPYLTRKMIELTPVRLMRVVKKTKARVHTSLINLTMVIRYTVILADKHTLQNEEKRVFRVKKMYIQITFVLKHIQGICLTFTEPTEVFFQLQMRTLYFCPNSKIFAFQANT